MALDRYRLPEGLLTYGLLALTATAGLFYVNIMPALVAGLVTAGGFDSRSAGFVMSANVYGAAAGALACVPFVRRLRWRPVQAGLLIAMIMLDMLSILMLTPALLIPLRALHGLLGGFSVGLGLSVIARTQRQDRAFGMLLCVQYGAGGLGVILIPHVQAALGPAALFLALAGLSALAFAALPFLPAFPVPAARPGGASGSTGSAPGTRTTLALALLALFLFQSGNMGLGAYMIGLGTSSGLEPDFVQPVVGIAAWTGALGSALVVALETRFGRVWPLTLAVLVNVAAAWTLHFSADPGLFTLANCVSAITWSMAVPYLFGICAALDRSGQWASLGGFFSKLGLASGPLAGALLLRDDRYGMLIDMSVLVLLACLAASFLSARRMAKRPLTAETV